MLPGLASNDHLLSFWNSITTQEDVSLCMCVLCVHACMRARVCVACERMHVRMCVFSIVDTEYPVLQTFYIFHKYFKQQLVSPLKCSSAIIHP